MNLLDTSEYHPYYELYLSKCEDTDIINGLRVGGHQFISFLGTIPNDKLLHRYAPYKWTIKEVLVHVIDTERIFAYRALRFARRDFTPLPGFDQDDYVLTSKANQHDFNDLISEFKDVRSASISLFKGFNDEDLMQKGMASNNPMSVRALGYILTGHQNHHQQIIIERYL